MGTIISWIAFVLSMVGAALCIFKRNGCWYLWLAANIAWIIYGLLTLQVALTLQEAVFVIVNIYGIKKWRHS